MTGIIVIIVIIIIIRTIKHAATSNSSDAYARKLGKEYQDIASIDGMDGRSFEYWCADLLKYNGFTNVKVTPGSGDQGVDIIALKDGEKYAIQCKRYSKDLSNKSVQEVNTGRTIYGCSKAAVMTNQGFTSGAVQAARAVDVQLWDRHVIIRMLSHKKEWIKVQNRAVNRSERVQRNKQNNQTPSSATETNEAKKSNIKIVPIVGISFTIILFIILLLGKTSTTSNTVNRPTTATNHTYVQTAQESIKKNDFNAALSALYKCVNNSPSPSTMRECETLLREIKEAVKENEPENGATLERTFQYFGNCIIRITAENGPTVITVVDLDNPDDYVRYYIRKGETADVTVRGGNYKVSYQTGWLWIDNNIGFGDVYHEGTVTELLKLYGNNPTGGLPSDLWETTV